MFGGIGMQEMMIIGIIAVVLFGKKLPEVAKSLGGSYREFKKGLTDIQHSFHETDYSSSTSASSSSRTSTPYGDYDDYEETTAPKFEPPSSEPQSEEKSESATS